MAWCRRLGSTDRGRLLGGVAPGRCLKKVFSGW